MDKNITPQKPRLLDQVRERIRYKHYSLSTEKVYVYWIRFFIRWSGLRHPVEMGSSEVEAFLTMLATDRHVSPSTHKQALCAILFLYKEVIQVDLPWMQSIGRPKTQQRLPVVFTSLEVQAILQQLERGHTEYALFAKLLYGTGMRIMEAARLRIKDIDFDRAAIIIREGKGAKERVVMLPESLRIGLQTQVTRCKQIWNADTETKMSGVEMPFSLDKKYPHAGHSFAWFWVFPQQTYSHDPRSELVRRHHLYPQTFRRAFTAALKQLAIHKPAAHTLFVIVLRRIYCKAVVIFVQCKICWATRMLVPP